MGAAELMLRANSAFSECPVRVRSGTDSTWGSFCSRSTSSTVVAFGAHPLFHSLCEIKAIIAKPFVSQFAHLNLTVCI